MQKKLPNKEKIKKTSLDEKEFEELQEIVNKVVDKIDIENIHKINQIKTMSSFFLLLGTEPESEYGNNLHEDNSEWVHVSSHHDGKIQLRYVKDGISGPSDKLKKYNLCELTSDHILSFIAKNLLLENESEYNFTGV